jgi:predicted nucleotidyltransferase
VNANDPNLPLLDIVAARLGEALLGELVFVGGAVAGLLITDPAMPSIRPTDDVDMICHALALTDYHRIEHRLREQGFVQGLGPDDPVCRWWVREPAIAVDIMPTLEHVLGFSNRWYPLALDTPQVVRLPGGHDIRLIAAPVFVATKLEAFAGRGGGDHLASHDLEDLLAVVDGRASLIDECRASTPELRAYLADRMRALLATPAFVDALSGHLPADAASQQRLPDLLDTLRRMAGLDTL